MALIGIGGIFGEGGILTDAENAKREATNMQLTEKTKANEFFSEGEQESPNRPDVPDIPVDPEKDMVLTLEKVIVEPQERYTVGDVVKYRIILRNEGSVRVNSFKIQDTLTSKGNDMGLDLGTFTTFTEPEGQTYLEAGETGYIDYEYKIKAEDVGGTVKNTVKLVEPKLPKPPKGEKEPEIEVVEPGIEEVEPELALEKNIVEQKARYTVGDVVKYRITLRNEGSVRVNNFKIQDTLTSRGNEMGLDLGTFTAFTDPAGQTYLEPGETGYIYYEYVIKEEDVGGTVKNTVKLVEPKLPKPPKGEKEPEIEVEPENPHITVDKQVISTPANGKAYVKGEIITYKIVVTNTGNIPLTNVVVTDHMERPNGTETIPSGFPNETTNTPGIYMIEVINPGESVEITVTHEVTEKDVEKGTDNKLINYVSVYTDQEVEDNDEEPVPVESRTFIIKKVEAKYYRPLEGAVIEIYKDPECEDLYETVDLRKNPIYDHSSNIPPVGKYYVKEKVVPDGYYAMEVTEFEITEDEHNEWIIENKEGFPLPATGEGCCYSLEVNSSGYTIAGGGPDDYMADLAESWFEVKIFRMASFSSDNSLKMIDKFETLPVEYITDINNANYDERYETIMRFISNNNIEPDTIMDGPGRKFRFRIRSVLI